MVITGNMLKFTDLPIGTTFKPVDNAAAGNHTLYRKTHDRLATRVKDGAVFTLFHNPAVIVVK